MEKEQKIIGTLLGNSSYYPKSYDIINRQITFCGMTKNTFVESSFLSEKLLQASEGDMHLNLDLMFKFCPMASSISPVNFIFHTALCGSTLLARTLEFGLDDFHVLKEPHVLHLLSIQQREALGNSDLTLQWNKIFNIIMQLLSRPLAPGERVIIKPTNHASNLVWHLLKLNPQNRAVYLYSELDDFLISCLKNEEGRKTDMRAIRRSWLENLLETLVFDFDWIREYSAKVNELTHAELTAICWFAQMKNVERVCAADNDSRIRIINFLQLLDDPRLSLDQTLSHFGIPMAQDRIITAVNHPALTRHSKFMHKAYSREKYFDDRKELLKIHEKEIEEGRRIVECLMTRHSWPSFFHDHGPVKMMKAQAY